MNTTTVTRSRGIEQLIAGHPTSDGAGVKLTRVLTHDLQRRLDPFLMLDAFGSDNPDDYIAGFPDHPHRGFETVTYMIAGRMRHRDSAGHEGLLENGGVQWMTAGRGVIHSEIPQQDDGVMEGFQLWLNLPGRDKMQPPWYRDFANAELPQLVTAQGVAVTVIAGESQGVTGAVTREATAPLYLDLHLPAGTRFTRPQGGMNLWVRLPEPLDAGELLLRAQREGVTYLPGRFFAVSKHEPGGLRLSFAGLEPAEILRQTPAVRVRGCRDSKQVDAEASQREGAAQDQPAEAVPRTAMARHKTAHGQHKYSNQVKASYRIPSSLVDVGVLADVGGAFRNYSSCRQRSRQERRAT